MAIEKKLKAVPPRPLTANGGTDGKVTIADTIGFKVKQQVILFSGPAGNLRVEVKRVESSTVLYVGPIGKHINDRTDVSAYTVVDGSTISAEEQQRPNVPEQEVERLTYEEEPVVARRVMVVDEYGDPITDTNPMPVDATVDVQVNVDAEDGDSVSIGAHPSQVRESSPDTITSAVFEEIFSYTSPGSNVRIVHVEATVSTPSLIRVLLNGTTIREKWTSPMERNVDFLFMEHLKLTTGDEVTVEAQVERFLHASYDTFTSIEGYLI